MTAIAASNGLAIRPGCTMTSSGAFRMPETGVTASAVFQKPTGDMLGLIDGNTLLEHFAQNAALGTSMGYAALQTFTADILQQIEADWFVDTERPLLAETATSEALPRTEAVTIMAIFRKDLFISVTLPLLMVAGSGLIGGWSMYTHLDSKLDASRSEAAAGIEKISDVLREELRADRDLRAKEFEALRTEMREDRRNTTNLLQELKNRS